MTRSVRIRAVQPLTGFVVRLELTDGSFKTVDLDRFLRGPIFEPIRSTAQAFAEVRVDPRAGTLVWPNGADIDPDVLCRDLAPAWEVAASASSATAH